MKEPVRRAQWFGGNIGNLVWTKNRVFVNYTSKKKDFIQESSDSNSRRKRQKVSDDTCVAGSLKRKRLQKDAYPSIWP